MRHDARAAAQAYAALHEGLSPEHMQREPNAPPPRMLVDLGSLLAVEYRKRTPRGPESYRHAFGEPARPALAHDEHGRLHVLGGHYTVTRRGIEDEDMKQNEYGFEVDHHDPYALHANPDGTAAAPSPPTTVRMLEHGAVMTAAGGAYMLAANAALRRSGLSYGWRAVAAAGVGIVTGVALARVNADAGLGVMVSGALVGLQNGAAEVSQRQMLASFQAQQQALPALPMVTQTSAPAPAVTQVQPTAPSLPAPTVPPTTATPSGTTTVAGTDPNATPAPAPAPTTMAGTDPNATPTPGTQPTQPATPGTTNPATGVRGVENVFLLPPGQGARGGVPRPAPTPAYHYSRSR